MTQNLPVVVVGAGPAGLAAAAELVERGLEPVVVEAGPAAGAAVREWGHVRLFSAWSELVAPAAGRLLEHTGWVRPDGGVYPTGDEWVAEYLEPLAAVLGDRVRYSHRVVGVARQGRDRVVDAGRDDLPLTVHVVIGSGSSGSRSDRGGDSDRDRGGDSDRGGEYRVTARALVDASGTWTNPNPLGGDGLPALGERASGGRVTYRVPRLADAQVRSRYAGRHVAVAGSGHSALMALAEFAELVGDAPGTRVSWLLRRPATAGVFGGGAADQLPARGALGVTAKAAIDAGRIHVLTGFRTASVESDATTDSRSPRLSLVAEDGQRIDGVDEVVVLTGFRPDHSWLSEVRLDLDAVLGAPTALAPLIDPNVHSCGTVYPHGAAELAQPEPGVYLVGMKSYGRAPTFLALTGYEQVRSVVAEIAGDSAAARRVELTLPETGVCGLPASFDTGASTDGVPVLALAVAAAS